MKKHLFFSLAALALAFFLVSPSTSHADIALMDGKLILSGFVKNTTYYRTSVYSREFNRGPGRNHKTRWDFSNFSALLETLYTVKDDQDSTIRIFSSYKGWYEMATSYDSRMRSNMYHKDRRQYQLPQNFVDDVIAEMYVDYISGPWQVRAGKQIVIWGQLDVNRVADVVNPLDLRWGVPGVDTWEEVKQGLWMIRTFYQARDLPVFGDLLFEVILNPGDYKALRLPYEGTHWGPEYFKNAAFAPGRGRGFYSWTQEKMRQDEPGWHRSNWEFGWRVQGFHWNIDWTLLYWNARSDGPSAAYIGRVNAHANQYVFAGLRAMITGNSLRTGPQPGNRVYKYKRMQTFGGTAQTFMYMYKDKFPTVWRVEWFWEHGSPIMRAPNGNVQNGPYRNTRKNIVAAALQGNWRATIPWFTRTIGRGKQFEFSLTYFHERTLKYDKDLVLFDRFYKPGAKYVDAFTFFCMQHMFNSSWVFVFIGNYYPQIKKWMAVPCFTYIFADSGHFSGFRFDIGMKMYGGAKGRYADKNMLSHVMDHKSSVILRLRYEF